MNFSLEGSLLIYAKDERTGRVVPIYKKNTITYNARNILADLIADHSSPNYVGYMTIGDRSLIIPSTEVREATFDFGKAVMADTDPAAVPAMIALGVASQAIWTGHPPTLKHITNTKDVTYSPILDADAYSATAEYTSVIPAEVVKVSLIGSDPDPDDDGNYAGSIFMWAGLPTSPTARIFSVAVLAQPLLLDPNYQYTIKYTYRIK